MISMDTNTSVTQKIHEQARAIFSFLESQKMLDDPNSLLDTLIHTHKVICLIYKVSPENFRTGLMKNIENYNKMYEEELQKSNKI